MAPADQRGWCATGRCRCASLAAGRLVLPLVAGVLVPGGFGDRGVEGKILAAHYARTKKVPYLGVCLGMQTAVIEYARCVPARRPRKNVCSAAPALTRCSLPPPPPSNVLDMPHANSEEFDQSSTQRVVVFMPEVNPSQMGGTMRLGSRRTLLVQPPSGGETMAQQLYGRRSGASCGAVVALRFAWSLTRAAGRSGDGAAPAPLRSEPGGGGAVDRGGSAFHGRG